MSLVMAGNSPANEKQSCIAAGVGATLEAEECVDKLVSQALVTHDASNVGTSRGELLHPVAPSLGVDLTNIGEQPIRLKVDSKICQSGLRQMRTPSCVR
jgi:hypothetical protein